MSEREVATAEDIFIDSSEQEHTIELGNNKVIKISLREPTWQNYTDAMRAFTKIDARTQKVSADYGAYYHSLLRSILAKSEPSFSADDLFRVKAEVGAQIQALLVEPGDFTPSGDDAKN
jgi:hypothetical protein